MQLVEQSFFFGGGILEAIDSFTEIRRNRSKVSEKLLPRSAIFFYFKSSLNRQTLWGLLKCSAAVATAVAELSTTFFFSLLFYLKW